MYIVMCEKKVWNVINNDYNLVDTIPDKIFREKDNAKDYIHNDILRFLNAREDDETSKLWKGAGSNENHVQMFKGTSPLEQRVYTIIRVFEGD